MGGCPWAQLWASRQAALGRRTGRQAYAVGCLLGWSGGCSAPRDCDAARQDHWSGPAGALLPAGLPLTEATPPARPARRVAPAVPSRVCRPLPVRLLLLTCILYRRFTIKFDTEPHCDLVKELWKVRWGTVYQQCVPAPLLHSCWSCGCAHRIALSPHPPAQRSPALPLPQDGHEIALHTRDHVRLDPPMDAEKEGRFVASFYHILCDVPL